MRLLSRTVILLSLVSLFTDTASEMLYPVLPLYLSQIGKTVLFMGVLEGLAGAIAGLSKGYFGHLSDERKTAMPFVRMGYGLSAIAKPLMVLFISPWWILLSRTIDRLGKGIRTGPRDGILSSQATPQTKGRVFGFHRGMDTLGAVLGPSIALLFLHFHPGQYKSIFLLAFAPGLLAVGATFLVREYKRAGVRPWTEISFSYRIAFGFWKESSHAYKKLVAGLLLFALINSSDFFLLLRMKERGLDDAQLIGVYIFYNLVYAIFSYPMGSLADRIGFRKTMMSGLLLFAVVYLGMAFTSGLVGFAMLWVLYGIFTASTESIATAWISNISGTEKTSSAVGTFTGLQSFAVFLASSLAGWVWFSFGAYYMFVITACATILIGFYFLLFLKD